MCWVSQCNLQVVSRRPVWKKRRVGDKCKGIKPLAIAFSSQLWCHLVLWEKTQCHAPFATSNLSTGFRSQVYPISLLFPVSRFLPLDWNGVSLRTTWMFYTLVPRSSFSPSFLCQDLHNGAYSWVLLTTLSVKTLDDAKLTAKESVTGQCRTMWLCYWLGPLIENSIKFMRSWTRVATKLALCISSICWGLKEC